jgi:hypothetical protein
MLGYTDDSAFCTPVIDITCHHNPWSHLFLQSTWKVANNEILDKGLKQNRKSVNASPSIPLERSAGLWWQQRWLLVYLERLLYCTHSPQFYAWIVVCIITQQIFVSPTPVIQNSKLQTRWFICSISDGQQSFSNLQHLCAIIDMMLWPTLKDWHCVGLISPWFSAAIVAFKFPRFFLLLHV